MIILLQTLVLLNNTNHQKLIIIPKIKILTRSITKVQKLMIILNPGNFTHSNTNYPICMIIPNIQLLTTNIKDRSISMITQKLKMLIPGNINYPKLIITLKV